MANYRRPLNKTQHEYLLKDYRNHRDAQGGIFTSDKRRKLLGVKSQSTKQRGEDTADFWYDVRTYVKNGITDLRLLAEVAHSDQLNEIFKDKNVEAYPKGDKRYARDDLIRFLQLLLSDRYGSEKTDSQNDQWKYELAHELVSMGLSFFQGKKNLNTELHQRIFHDVNDVISLTYNRYSGFGV